MYVRSITIARDLCRTYMYTIYMYIIRVAGNSHLETNFTTCLIDDFFINNIKYEVYTFAALANIYSTNCFYNAYMLGLVKLLPMHAAKNIGYMQFITML